MGFELAYKGAYITDLPFPGLRKADGVMPSHPKCVQVAFDRFLVVSRDSQCSLRLTENRKF